MSIKCFGFSYKSLNFPCGEKHVVIKDIENLPSNIIIEMDFEKNEEIIELLMLCDAIKNLNGRVDTLLIPYVPFSRQDRINIQGECFSLRVFCNLINSIDAKVVRIYDPHSDVTAALLNNCEIIPQYEIFEKMLIGKKDFFLVSPDAGSLKKIYKIAAINTPLGIVECSKKRNPLTGEITGVHVPCGQGITNEFVIVDDICDGGRTFIEIAKEIKSKNSSKVTLLVTHGFFTKGLAVFEGLIDAIYTRKGQIK